MRRCRSTPTAPPVRGRRGGSGWPRARARRELAVGVFTVANWPTRRLLRHRARPGAAVTLADGSQVWINAGSAWNAAGATRAACRCEGRRCSSHPRPGPPILIDTGDRGSRGGTVQRPPAGDAFALSVRRGLVGSASRPRRPRRPGWRQGRDHGGARDRLAASPDDAFAWTRGQRSMPPPAERVRESAAGPAVRVADAATGRIPSPACWRWTTGTPSAPPGGLRAGACGSRDAPSSCTGASACRGV